MGSVSNIVNMYRHISLLLSAALAIVQAQDGPGQELRHPRTHRERSQHVPGHQPEAGRGILCVPVRPPDLTDLESHVVSLVDILICYDLLPLPRRGMHNITMQSK